MAKRELSILAALTVGAGFIGGTVSSVLLRGTPAIAQASEQQGTVRESITAKAFVLVDEGGKERASLRIHDDGVTRLTILDTAGKRRASLSVTKSGISTLMLSDATEETRASLMTRSDGGPILALLDATGEVRASLAASKDGAPALKMWDATGKTIWSAP